MLVRPGSYYRVMLAGAGIAADGGGALPGAIALRWGADVSALSAPSADRAVVTLRAGAAGSISAGDEVPLKLPGMPFAEHAGLAQVATVTGIEAATAPVREAGLTASQSWQLAAAGALLLGTVFLVSRIPAHARAA